MPEMRPPPCAAPPLTTPSTTVLPYFSELMYTQTRPHNIACPVLRYGDPLHARSSTPRSRRKGLGLPPTGQMRQVRQKRGRFKFQTCRGSQSWLASDLALSAAGAADAAAFLKNFSATKLSNSTKLIRCNSILTISVLPKAPRNPSCRPSPPTALGNLQLRPT